MVNALDENKPQEFGTAEWIQHAHTMSRLQQVPWNGVHLSLLQAACLHKRVQTVQFLLEHKVNIQHKDELSGCTALFYAPTIVPTELASLNISTTLERVLAILTLLLKHGGDISDTDNTGGTVLHHVVFPEYFQRMYDDSSRWKLSTPVTSHRRFLPSHVMIEMSSIKSE